jgi:hypothetical protein
MLVSSLGAARVRRFSCFGKAGLVVVVALLALPQVSLAAEKDATAAVNHVGTSP